MDKAVLCIEMEKQEDGSFKDHINCSGTEVEVLGMVEKSLIILNGIKKRVVESIESKGKEELK